MARQYHPLGMSVVLSGVLAGGLAAAAPLMAQETGTSADADARYRVRSTDTFSEENAGRPAAPPITRVEPGDAPPADTLPTDTKNQGPVRLARFAYVHGNVSWRADDGMDWSAAGVNLPLRQSAQVWVTDGGRAEIQFDDGSLLRLGNGAVVTLKTLFSDAQGEFTQITLNEGLATLRSRHDVSVFQIDTPLASVKTKGEAQVRVGIDSGTEVAVQRGSAAIEGAQGKLTLAQNEYLDLPDATASYHVRPLPGQDAWDRWNDERNRLMADRPAADRHLPPNIDLVAGDLNDYGDWRQDDRYGWVWSPRGVAADWRPYYHGRWTWVEPFGWTWVSDEAWGWAPYHYGTWVNQPYGWAWVPGPVHQYWSPAVVNFSYYDGAVAWAPLCPWEVRYPSAFSLGVFGSDWGFAFSIGFAGVYYPYGGRYCYGRPFSNFYVNHFGYGGFGYGGYYGDRFHNFNHYAAFGGSHFVPYNAHFAAGATFASVSGFGGHGGYQAIPCGQTTLFTRGQALAAGAGHAPVSGPPSVQASRLAMTPSRSFNASAHPSQAALGRGVYHAALPSNVQRSLPGGQSARNVASASPQRAGAGTETRGSNPGSAANRANAASQARASLGSGSGSGSSFTRVADNRSANPAEAARQARASLGMTGGESRMESGSGSARNAGLYGSERTSGATGRSGGYGARTGGSDSRYSGSAGRGETNSGAGGRNYGGYSRSDSGGSYHVGGDYGGRTGGSGYSGRGSSGSGGSSAHSSGGSGAGGGGRSGGGRGR